jgi:hypothetical protein
MKKCPPGVICLENYSMFFLMLCIFIIGYLIYTNTDKSVTVNNSPSEKIIIKISIALEHQICSYGCHWITTPPHLFWFRLFRWNHRFFEQK